MNPTARGQRVLDALRTAVARELDRKRRLGQYAVVWQNGRVVRLEPHEITPEMTDESNPRSVRASA
jgi:hypothetical protein